MANYFVHKLADVESGAEIGEGTKIWRWTHIMAGATIGKNCRIGSHVSIEKNTKLGNNVKVQNKVNIYSGVTLEDDVFCGPSMTFTNDLNPRSAYPKGEAGWIPTLVKKGASIGANATILCGMVIGKHAFIGAGAVVIKDVPDYALVVGNPAKQIGWVCECAGGFKPKTVKLEFDSAGKATCPNCKRNYSLKNGMVSSINESSNS